MLGSPTAPGRPGARAGAPVRVAFHSTHSVGVPRVLFSRLNTQPMRTPVNASRIHPFWCSKRKLDKAVRCNSRGTELERSTEGRVLLGIVVS